MNNLIRYCPKCEKELIYSYKSTFYAARKHNWKCKSCSVKGRKLSNESKSKISQKNKGKIRTEETKKKQSLIKIGKSHPMTNETKKKISLANKKWYSNIKNRQRISILTKKSMKNPEIRKKHIQSMISNGRKNRICLDKGQLEMIEKWNNLGFNFELNYPVYTDDFLCYIDGYDKEKNVVMEYDSKYHRLSNQKEKDLVRQNKIIDILHPKKFWRFDFVNKSWKNIIGDIL